MKSKVSRLILLTVLVTPLSTFANNDDGQYPATSFQPKVIFIDESVKLATASSSFDSNYPAANFQPKVLYVDASAKSSSFAGGSTGEKSAFDPNYPAANFSPKVIYP